MHALNYPGELLASDRPTIPVPPPRESGVRLKVERVAYAAATVDVVVCDLSRDPRSEDYASSVDRVASLGDLREPDGYRSCESHDLSERRRVAHRSGFFPARCAPRFGAFAVVVAQNDRPPSTSIVRALK